MILPIDSDSHHVHKTRGNVSIEEERKDSAELRAQGPLFVHISGTWGINTGMGMAMDMGEEIMMKMGVKIVVEMMNLDAVRGRLIALKRRSETAKLKGHKTLKFLQFF